MYLSRGLGSATTGAADLITSLAPSYGVPPSLALAVAQQESGLNANAIGSAGEIGLFQVKPSTAAQFGVSASGLYDPNQNAVAGLSYLSQLFQRFGNWFDALVAYNAGPSRVSNPPSSSQAYASKALAAAGPLDSSSAPESSSSNGSASPMDSELSFLSEGSTGLSPLAWGALGLAAAGLLAYWATA